MEIIKVPRGFEIPGLNMKIVKTPSGYKIEGGKIGARAYLNSAQDNIGTSATTVHLDAENYDLGENFDTTTYKFIVLIPGYYDVSGQIRFNGITVNVNLFTYVYLGNDPIFFGHGVRAAGNLLTVFAGESIYHFDKDDIITLVARSPDDGNIDLAPGSGATFLSVFLITPD